MPAWATSGAAEWLVDEFHLTATDARAYADRALRTACRHRHVDFARWLVARFDIGLPEDGRVRDGEMLRSACANGDREMVEWLVETYQLGPDDARACGNEALRGACAAGATDVVESLLWSFMLGAPDLVEARAIEAARSAGHRELANQLCRTFDLDGADDEPTGAPAEDPVAAEPVAEWPNRTPEQTAMIAEQVEMWAE